MTSQSPFPYRPDSAAKAYASLMSTNLGAYEDLPGHHLCFTLNLVVSVPNSEYPDSLEPLDPEVYRLTAQRHRMDEERGPGTRTTSTSADLIWTPLTTTMTRPESASILMKPSHRIQSLRTL